MAASSRRPHHSGLPDRWLRSRPRRWRPVREQQFVGQLLLALSRTRQSPQAPARSRRGAAERFGGVEDLPHAPSVPQPTSRQPPVCGPASPRAARHLRLEICEVPSVRPAEPGWPNESKHEGRLAASIALLLGRCSAPSPLSTDGALRVGSCYRHWTLIRTTGQPPRMAVCPPTSLECD